MHSLYGLGVLYLRTAYPKGLKIPPGPQGTNPENARHVQVQEQVAKKPPVYTLNCPKTVNLGQFRV